MASWVVTKNLVFSSGYNVPILFRNLREVFSVQEAWHSPNTAPTNEYGPQSDIPYYKLITLTEVKFRQL